MVWVKYFTPIPKRLVIDDSTVIRLTEYHIIAILFAERNSSHNYNNKYKVKLLTGTFGKYTFQALLLSPWHYNHGTMLYLDF